MIVLPADQIVVRTEARFISKLNVEAAYGRPWSWLLDLLPELRKSGVEVFGTRKTPMVRADDLDAFLRTRCAVAVVTPSTDPANDLDEIDGILARGGTVRACKLR